MFLNPASSPQLVWSPTLNRGPESHLCWVLAFSNWSGLQTNRLAVLVELYNSSKSTFLCESQIALIQPIHGQGYILLFLDRMHLLFIQVHFLFLQPGRFVGQYTTHFIEDEAYKYTGARSGEYGGSSRTSQLKCNIFSMRDSWWIWSYVFMEKYKNSLQLKIFVHMLQLLRV